MRNAPETYRQISRATGIIIGLTLLDKALAVVKEMLTAHRFGVSGDLDAFNIALAFPGVMILFLTTAFVSALVPLYLEWAKRYSTAEANRQALSLFYGLVVFFALFTLVSYLLSPFVLGVMGYGFNLREKELGLTLGRLLVFLIFLDGTGILLRGLLHAQKDFFSLYLATTLINVTIIVMLVAGRGMGIHALVWGTLLGTCCRTLYMGFVLHRSDFRFLPSRLPSKETLTAFLMLAIPLMGSELMVSSNLLIDQAMATQLDSGSVSTLRYAYRINDMPVQVIVLAISKAIFPYVVEQKINRDADALRDFFKHAVILLGFLSFPMICLAGLYSREAVGLLLQRGAFDAPAADQTARTLVYYSLGLFFYAYTFVNATFFSAMKDVKTLFYMGCLAMLLNIVFNLLFMRWMGVRGIALSSTVTQGLISIIFMGVIKRRLEIEGLSEIFRNLVPVAIACGAAFAVGYWLRLGCRELGVPPVFYLPASGLVLGTCYLVLLRYIGGDELRTSVTLMVRRELVSKILGAPRRG